MFGLYELQKGLIDGGFVPSGLDVYDRRSAFQKDSFSIPVPNSDDVCKIDVNWNGYFRTGTKFYPLQRHRLRDEQGRMAIGGGISRVNFNVAKKVNDPYRKSIAYKTKAPKKSVEYCRQKFNEVANNSMIKIIPEIDLT